MRMGSLEFWSDGEVRRRKDEGDLSMKLDRKPNSIE